MKFLGSNQLKGSSHNLPAHGSGGARARFQSPAAKKSARPSVKIEASPAAGSERAEPSKILFSLIEEMFWWTGWGLNPQPPPCHGGATTN